MHDWPFILKCVGIGLCSLVFGLVYFTFWFRMLYEASQIRPRTEAMAWMAFIFFSHLLGALVFCWYLERHKQGRYDLSRLDSR